jgi:FdhD protein
MIRINENKGVDMEPVHPFSVVRIRQGRKVPYEDTLIREIKLSIHANGEEIAALMATPVDQEALAIGYLMSENILADASDITNITLREDGAQVAIAAQIDEDAAQRLNAEGVVISGCGRSKTANIDPDAIAAAVNTVDFSHLATQLSEEMNGFEDHCRLYRQTGSVHTAMLLLESGESFTAEDIAQHNTVDKAIGKARLAGADTTRSALFVSGRLSSEMVAKAVMHAIPIVVSRTASTCLGVQIADKFGVTLIGFARKNNMNIYTHDQRITTEEQA